MQAAFRRLLPQHQILCADRTENAMGYWTNCRMRIARQESHSIEGGRAIITTIRVPKTGGLPTTKVNVIRWLKREGENVKRGDAIVELETEKATYELDSPENVNAC
jgi:hypothetical protein